MMMRIGAQFQNGCDNFLISKTIFGANLIFGFECSNSLAALSVWWTKQALKVYDPIYEKNSLNLTLTLTIKE